MAKDKALTFVAHGVAVDLELLRDVRANSNGTVTLIFDQAHVVAVNGGIKTAVAVAKAFIAERRGTRRKSK